MSTLVAPSGADIEGTLDRVPGTALCTPTRDEDGGVELELHDETDLDWNKQATVRFRGERVYVDTSGNYWLENELIEEGEVPTAAESEFTNAVDIGLVDKRALATMRAALTLWNRLGMAMVCPLALQEIATEGGTLEILTRREVDRMVQYLADQTWAPIEDFGVAD